MSYASSRSLNVCEMNLVLDVNLSEIGMLSVLPAYRYWRSYLATTRLSMDTMLQETVADIETTMSEMATITDQDGYQYRYHHSFCYKSNSYRNRFFLYRSTGEDIRAMTRSLDMSRQCSPHLPLSKIEKWQYHHSSSRSIFRSVECHHQSVIASHNWRWGIHELDHEWETGQLVPNSYHRSKILENMTMRDRYPPLFYFYCQYR